MDLPELPLPTALAPYREVLAPTVRPYVRLHGVRAPAQPWTSILGGVPYRPLGTSWPLSRDGHPLAFLAQLNFAEFPPLPGFPTHGIVQFFIRDNDHYGANFEGSFDLPSLADDANFRVLYYPEVVEDAALLETGTEFQPNPLGGLPHDPAQTFVLRGERATGPVTADDRLFEHLVGQGLWHIGEATPEDTDELMTQYAQLAGEGHKLSGSPNFTQSDPRTPEDPHVLLFQLDSDDDLDLMWGDVGIANFFIDPGDLARLDFSRVVYHWDCC